MDNWGGPRPKWLQIGLGPGLDRRYVLGSFPAVCSGWLWGFTRGVKQARSDTVSHLSISIWRYSAHAYIYIGIYREKSKNQ